jgi:hypothetical protein
VAAIHKIYSNIFGYLRNATTKDYRSEKMSTIPWLCESKVFEVNEVAGKEERRNKADLFEGFQLQVEDKFRMLSIMFVSILVFSCFLMVNIYASQNVSHLFTIRLRLPSSQFLHQGVFFINLSFYELLHDN